MVVVVPFVDGDGAGTLDEAQLVIFDLGGVMLARSPAGRWLELVAGDGGDVWVEVSSADARAHLAAQDDGSTPIVTGPMMGLVCRLALAAWFPAP